MNLALLRVKKARDLGWIFCQLSFLGWKRDLSESKGWLRLNFYKGTNHMRELRMIEGKKGFFTLFTLFALKAWFNKLLIDLNPPLQQLAKVPVKIIVQKPSNN